MLRIGICDDIREEVEKQEKQVRQITYQIGIRADIRKMLFRYGSFDGNRTERTIRYYPAGY